MAGDRKADVEALQVAVDTERKGYAFYRAAAKATKDPKGREVFERLARDEIEHMAVFAALYESLSRNEPWMTYEQAAARFGQTDPSRLIFPQEPREAHRRFSDLEALEFALETERRAVEFYRDLAARSSDAVAREFYSSLEAIEEGHVKVIQAEIDSLTGAGIWLGYQEISLED